jgi:hypothetical protein
MEVVDGAVGLDLRDDAAAPHETAMSVPFSSSSANGQRNGSA